MAFSTHEIGGRLQFGRRQRLQILNDGFERAHYFKVPRLGGREIGSQQRLQVGPHDLLNAVNLAKLGQRLNSKKAGRKAA